MSEQYTFIKDNNFLAKEWDRANKWLDEMLDLAQSNLVHIEQQAEQIKALEARIKTATELMENYKLMLEQKICDPIIFDNWLSENSEDK